MTVPSLKNEHFSDASRENLGEEKGDSNANVINVSLRTFKVIVIGDSGVGKTCLTLRICGGKFPEINETTIGVDVKVKKIQVGEENINLQIWDSAGQERFRYGLVPHYYRNAHAVIFVYDVTNRSSFENISKWVVELQKNVGVTANITQIIIGNKCDLHADRQVGFSEAKALSSAHGLPLWETSAKSDMEAEVITEIFQSLAETLKQKKPLLSPHYSQIMQADHNKGLRIRQSASTGSLDKKKSVRTKYKKRLSQHERKKCCA